MQFEQMQRAIAPHAPSLLAAAATAFLMALMAGGATFIWWYIKRRIARKEAQEDQQGPVLHKIEHDEMCDAVEEERIDKMNEILDAVEASSKAQQDGFKEVSQKFTRVHTRIDETQKLIVDAVVRGKVIS
jgi:shikimate kinase